MKTTIDDTSINFDDMANNDHEADRLWKRLLKKDEREQLPRPGDIRYLADRNDVLVLILQYEEGYSRVAPIERGTNNAGTLDVIISKSDLFHSVYTIFLSASSWIREEGIGGWYGEVEPHVLKAAVKMDKGEKIEEDENIRYGIVDDDQDVEALREEHRSAMFDLMARFSISAGAIISELEDRQSKSIELITDDYIEEILHETVKIFKFPLAQLGKNAQPCVYKLAALDSSHVKQENSFWQKERSAKWIDLVKTQEFEARLSFLEGCLYFIFERADVCIKSVDKIILWIGKQEIISSETPEFKNGNSLHFYLPVNPEILSKNPQAKISFCVNQKKVHKAEILFHAE